MDFPKKGWLQCNQNAKNLLTFSRFFRKILEANQEALSCTKVKNMFEGEYNVDYKHQKPHCS